MRGRTLINLAFSIILWLLGATVLLLNLLDLWSPWTTMGTIFLIYLPLPTILTVQSTSACYKEFKAGNKSPLIPSAVLLAVNIAVILFTMTVSASWI